MAENVRVDVPNCSIVARQMHAKPQSQHGQVIFHTKVQCDLIFTTVAPNNPVFNVPSPYPLHVGANPLDVACEVGQTEVKIAGCLYALSDPTDIIVP
jgi:hypothetical protein